MRRPAAAAGPAFASFLLVGVWTAVAGAQPPEPETRKPAQVAVRTNVPAADVIIDGNLVGRTPLASPVAIVPGDHLVELRRRGYRDVRRQLTLAEGARADLNVELFEDPGTPASETGTLAVAVSEDNAVLLVNGQARTIARTPRPLDRYGVVPTSIPGLPLGPHVLRVQRAGFLPHEEVVVVPGGQTAVVNVTLRPTPETYMAYVNRTRALRGWAVTAVSAGFVVAIASGALAITRHASLPDARRYREEERREQEVPMNGGPCDPSLGLSDAMKTLCADRLRAAYDAVSVRERLRMLGLIGTGVGLLAAAAGVYLLATSDDPRRYDELAARPAPPPRLWAQPWLAPEAGAGGLALGVRF
jgi:hypothetical protein